MSSNSESAKRLANALAKVASEFPEAFDGSGQKIRGANKNAQSLNKRQILSVISRWEKDEAKVQKLENAWDAARKKRDENLSARLESLRATREWLQYHYPEKNHPVRKRFEELVR